MSAERSPVSTQTLERLKASGKPLFNPGQIVATPGALALLEKHHVRPLTPLSFHLRGRWGEVDGDDWAANDAGVVNGGRLISAFSYTGTEGESEKLWIITDAVVDDSGTRLATTLLLPSEY